MKVVHINRPQIQADSLRQEAARLLREKWERQTRARIQKKYAASSKEQPRT